MAFKGKFTLTVLSIQVAFIVIYAFFVEYGKDLDAASPQNYFVDSSNAKKSPLHDYYPMFQDTNAIVFIGVGFLYTFIKKYSLTGVTMNMLLAGVSIQWAVITQNWWNTADGKIHIDVVCLLAAEFAAVSAVIAMGGLMGKTSFLQMVIFALLEVFIYTTNEHLTLKWLHVSDTGASVSLHMFCGIFGCAAAYALDKKLNVQGNPNDDCSYQSNLFTMMGTVLLWCFWPSFNASSTHGDEQYRVVMNTFLALLGSCLTAFAMSSLLHKEKKFTMGHIQNSTLAGGVAIGATCNLMVKPFGALTIGSIGGCLSVLGFKYLGPLLARIKVYDPAGINSLHALPGLFAGLAAVGAAWTANEVHYGHNLYTIYPAMAPIYNSSELWSIQAQSPDIQAGMGRSAAMQACFQFIYIIENFIVAILTGIITGTFLRLRVFDPVDEKQMYLDEVSFDLPDVEETKKTISITTYDSKL